MRCEWSLSLRADDRAGQPRDENFQGYGIATTDATGSYEFLTIKPVPYPGRTPHIHVAVSGHGLERFVTQMYVAGEPGNDRDPVLMGVRDPQRVPASSSRFAFRMVLPRWPVRSTS